MNERIKQLAEQATSIVESPPNREGWTSSYAYFDKEKFAELILQDCMSICEDLGDKGLDGHYCVDKIRREFGV